jgi:hypothetical protein
LGHSLFKGRKFCFLKIWGIWVSKDAEFYVDFNNINLPLYENAPKYYISMLFYFKETCKFEIFLRFTFKITFILK